jgi:outer membrane murein-binding lipoprotein Lpp
MRPPLVISQRLNVLLLVLALVGCSRYAELSSEAYEYSKALYSVCNRRDAPRLQKLAVHLETARAEARLTEREADWLAQIVATATAGDWPAATREARRLLESQIVHP